MITNMTCKICGSTSFMFRWSWKDDAELTRLSLCHDGWGLQFTDSEICCSVCKKWTPYEQEDFIKNVDELSGEYIYLLEYEKGKWAFYTNDLIVEDL